VGAKKPPLAEMLKRAPQLRLKDNRQRNKEQRHGLLQKPRDHMQIKITRHDRHAEKNKNPLRERNGTRIFKHDIDAVEDDRHDQDIENIQRSDGRQNAVKLCRHRKIKRHKDPPGKIFPSHLYFPKYIPTGKMHAAQQMLSI